MSATTAIASGQPAMTDQVTLLRQLYASISDGVTGERLAAFFHPSAEQVEHPSLLRPHGHRRSLAEILEGAELGASMIEDQHFDVHHVVEQDEHVAVELTWTATLAMDAGGIPAGTPLVAHVAAFYVFRDGLVLRQCSYDCYEQLPS